MAASSPPPAARADWYPDPTDGRLIRYWDGRRWTAHTAPRPYEQYIPTRPPPAPPQQSSSTVVPALIAVAVIVLMLFGGLLLTLADSSEPRVDEPRSATPSPSTPTPTPTPVRTKPARSIVPPVTGMSRAKAEQQLAAVGLVVVEVRQVPSALPRGTVVRQSRRVGASILSGSEVVLTVAVPYPRVPDVVGRLESAAVSRLRDAGFKVTITTESRTSGRDGIVLRQTPTGSRRAEPRSTIAIVVASVTRTVLPPPPPPQDCESGYSPCLAPAYDYDCAGGSGDGPEYAYGPIYVTGSDPYDLDRDGDGVACES